METKNELARITIDLPLDLQKKLKSTAAINRMSMREIVIKSIEKELRQLQETKIKKP